MKHRLKLGDIRLKYEMSELWDMVQKSSVDCKTGQIGKGRRNNFST